MVLGINSLHMAQFMYGTYDINAPSDNPPLENFGLINNNLHTSIMSIYDALSVDPGETLN